MNVLRGQKPLFICGDWTEKLPFQRETITKVPSQPNQWKLQNKESKIFISLKWIHYIYMYLFLRECCSLLSVSSHISFHRSPFVLAYFISMYVRHFIYHVWKSNSFSCANFTCINMQTNSIVPTNKLKFIISRFLPYFVRQFSPNHRNWTTFPCK